MTALPLSSDFTGSTITEAQMKAALAGQRDFLSGLLGADGLPATAVKTLGALGSFTASKTAAYSLTTADRGVIFSTNNGWTFSLLTLANAGNGFTFFVRNNGAAATITLAASGAELIEGASTYPLLAGQAVLVFCNGAQWKVLHLGGTPPLLQKSYLSAAQTITLSGGLTLAHSLGAQPGLVRLALQCATAEANYAVGDLVTDNIVGVGSFLADATNVGIRFASAITILNKTTGATATITAANWRLIVRAWL